MTTGGRKCQVRQKRLHRLPAVRRESHHQNNRTSAFSGSFFLSVLSCVCVQMRIHTSMSRCRPCPVLWEHVRISIWCTAPSPYGILLSRTSFSIGHVWTSKTQKNSIGQTTYCDYFDDV